MRALDDFLIDRVAQRISDALARWCSCYGIAAFLYTGSLLGFIAGGVTQVAQDSNWLSFAFIAVCFPLMGLRIWTANGLDKKTMLGVMPNTRIAEFFSRTVLSVIFLPSNGAGLLMVEQRGRQIISAAWMIFAIGNYFLACRKNPPKPRRATVPVGAAFSSR